MRFNELAVEQIERSMDRKTENSNENTKGSVSGISLIKRAEIQAQVMVPLLKVLRDELGEERAYELVEKSVGDLYRRLGQEFWSSMGETDLGLVMASAFQSYSRDDALSYTVTEQSPDAFEFEVDRCRYAEFFKNLGEPELGFLLVCSADFPFTEGFDDNIELTRSQTIMQGASHCDFCYKRRKETK